MITRSTLVRTPRKNRIPPGTWAVLAAVMVIQLMNVCREEKKEVRMDAMMPQPAQAVPVGTAPEPAAQD